mgnify:CR=1 FL=1
MAAQRLVAEGTDAVSTGILYDLVIGKQFVPFVREVLQPGGTGTRCMEHPGFAGSNSSADKFRLQKLKENGRLDWELLAAEVVTRGDALTLSDVHLVLYRDDGDQLELRTPACTFDRLKKQGRGAKHVNIRNRNLVLDGVGFDFDTARKTVVIRSRVHVTIQRRGTKPLAGLAQPGPLGEPAK